MAKVKSDLKTRLTRDELGRARAILSRKLFKELRRVYRTAYEQEGLSQQDIADKLGIDKALVSKRLNGQANLTMNTISDLMLAMGARLETKATILKELEQTKTSGFDIAECLTITERIVTGRTVWVSKQSDAEDFRPNTLSHPMEILELQQESVH